MTLLRLSRAYEAATKDDGYRVYIDRLWPRGLSHETFHYDLWTKEIAPSDGLRHWFHADPTGRWDEFCSRYAAELATNPDWAAFVAGLEPHPAVTLIYSSHDEQQNNAIVVEQALVKNYPEKFSLN